MNHCLLAKLFKNDPDISSIIADNNLSESILTDSDSDYYFNEIDILLNKIKSNKYKNHHIWNLYLVSLKIKISLLKLQLE